MPRSTTIAEHEFETDFSYAGDQLVLDRLRCGRYSLAMDGADDLETVIYFDGVHIERNFVEFSEDGLRVGQLEGSPENWGEVGEKLQRIASMEARA